VEINVTPTNLKLEISDIQSDSTLNKKSVIHHLLISVQNTFHAKHALLMPSESAIYGLRKQKVPSKAIGKRECSPRPRKS
jgi:hypothetical protein